jgi:hypothetical protein
MATHLKDLLRHAVARARITRQVDAMEIISFTTDALSRTLPDALKNRVRAVSYKNGLITVEVVGAAVRHALIGTEINTLDKLRQTFPEKKFEKISMRVCRIFSNVDSV